MTHPLQNIVPTLFAIVGLALNGAAWIRHQNTTTQQPNRAGLVVRFGDGHAQTVCVSFTEERITGYDLLNRSGFNVIADVSSSMGAFICKIGNDGCNFPQEDCACKFNTEQKYWSYWLLRNGAWEYSNFGASNASVINGEVQGWVWGTGSNNATADSKPPVFTFDQICAMTNETPIAPTSTPTYTPQPTFTSTPSFASIVTGGQPLPTNTTEPSPTATEVLPTPSATQPLDQKVLVGSETSIVTSATTTPQPTTTSTATASPTAQPSTEPIPSTATVPPPIPTQTPIWSPTQTSTSTPPATHTQTPSQTPRPSPTQKPNQPTPKPIALPSPKSPTTNGMAYAAFGLMTFGLIGGLILMRLRR
jgi:hypothetical protein